MTAPVPRPIRGEDREEQGTADDRVEGHPAGDDDRRVAEDDGGMAVAREDSHRGDDLAGDVDEPHVPVSS